MTTSVEVVWYLYVYMYMCTRSISHIKWRSKYQNYETKIRTQNTIKATPGFPFVLNQSLMGLFIVPSYGNVQLGGDSNIA